MENTITITRKYTLIPTFADTKEWTKKVMEYTKESYPEKIDYYKKKLKQVNKEDEDKKLEIKNKIASLKEQQKEFEENGTLIQTNVIDYTYDLVRRAMASESYRKNRIINYVTSELFNREAVDMDFKERNKLISELTNYGYRLKGSKKGSLFDNMNVDNPLNGYGVAFSQALTSKIKDVVNKKKLLNGKDSGFTYKNDSPFTIAKQYMSFTYDYNSFDELCEHIKEKDCNVYFNFGGNGKPTIARFKINFGANRKNKDELIATMMKILSGEYEYCGSNMGIHKNKIVLNLSIKVPRLEKELDENTIVGVDLGIAVPAVCALNNSYYGALKIGNKDDFLKVRTQLRNQRERLQRSLERCSGGHGKKKKLRALKRLEKKEANFSKTYCHMVSKKVVDYALKHHAKYINIENLTGYNTNNFILSNWSYYRLQNDIIYKAKRHGIVVRKINPAYTSQVCSVCGGWHKDNRPKGDKGQAYFYCHNEDCKSHDKKMYKYGLNADVNAARNIAKSELWMGTGKTTEASKEAARKYYGIPDDIDDLYTKKKEKKNTED